MNIEYRIVMFDDEGEIVCIRDDINEDFTYAEAIYSGLVDVDDQDAVEELVNRCMLWAEVDYGSVLPWLTHEDLGVAPVPYLARTSKLARP